jgi:hypothetical protein
MQFLSNLYQPQRHARPEHLSDSGYQHGTFMFNHAINSRLIKLHNQPSLALLGSQVDVLVFCSFPSFISLSRNQRHMAEFSFNIRLPSILISRFMLNLRQVDEKSKGLGTNGYETIPKSALRFNANALIGNMGESLQFGDDNFQDEEDESVLTQGSSAESEMSSDVLSIRQEEVNDQYNNAIVEDGV